jgi:hypothetical protein
MVALFNTLPVTYGYGPHAANNDNKTRSLRVLSGAMRTDELIEMLTSGGRHACRTLTY